MKNIFTGIGIMFTFLFAWAVYVQHNDPDASKWYVIYSLAALASVLFVVRRLPSTVAFLLCFLAMVGANFLWPEKFEGFTIGEGDIENVERGREAWGLIIIAVVMLLYALRARFEKRLKV